MPAHRFLRHLPPVLLLVVTGFLLLHGTGCDSTGPEEPTDAPPPRPLTAAEEQVVNADNRFGLKLLRSTMDAEEPSTNVFLSPLSVSMALGMTLNGARMGATLEKQGLYPSSTAAKASRTAAGARVGRRRSASIKQRVVCPVTRTSSSPSRRTV